GTSSHSIGLRARGPRAAIPISFPAGAVSVLVRFLWRWLVFVSWVATVGCEGFRIPSPAPRGRPSRREGTYFHRPLGGYFTLPPGGSDAIAAGEGFSHVR